MNEISAIEWCVKNQAEVKFLRVHAVDRVEISVGGGYVVERDTIIEAVQAVQKLKVHK